MKRKLFITLGIGLFPITLLGCGITTYKEETKSSLGQLEVTDTLTEDTDSEKDAEEKNTSDAIDKNQQQDSTSNNTEKEKENTIPKESSKETSQKNSSKPISNEQSYAEAEKLGTIVINNINDANFSLATENYNKIENKDYLSKNTELKRKLDISIKNQEELDYAQSLYNKGNYNTTIKILDDLLLLEIVSSTQSSQISNLHKLTSDKLAEESKEFTYDVALNHLLNYLGSEADKYTFEYFQTNDSDTILISASLKSDPIIGNIYVVHSSGEVEQAS